MNTPYAFDLFKVDPAELAEFNRGTTRAKRAYWSISQPELTVLCECGARFATRRGRLIHKTRYCEVAK